MKTFKIAGKLFEVLYLGKTYRVYDTTLPVTAPAVCKGQDIKALYKKVSNNVRFWARVAKV